MLQLRQHRFFSVHRGTFSNKQPLGQILLVKGLENILSYNGKTLFHEQQQVGQDEPMCVCVCETLNITINESKDDHDLIQHFLQFLICRLFVSSPKL